MSKNSFKNISMDYDTYQDELNCEYRKGYKSGVELSLRVIEKITDNWTADDVIHEFFDYDATEQERQIVNILCSQFEGKSE